MIPAKFKNPNLGMKNLSDYKWGDKGVPTRANCDPNNPREFALWAFTAVPGLNGAALMLPPDFFMLVSEHLWELGFRHAEEPIKKYRPPSATDPYWSTSPGMWVPVETPDVEVDPAEKAAAKLSPIQKAELRAIANAEHNGEPLPYNDASPSRVVWKTLRTDVKERLRAILNEEHESEP